ncbi:hypothetical protein GIB67_005189 [Kingdonia uniflora]|uniref:65-kDa microtubule-associated protein 6 n=1 Tax=Kingdonia uniflora TaxID=39325 RepID=A0A7J7NMX9_9MAGN|nr:hypothetical protein GIB67_005189 [Kingdonia uniflora]
MGVSCGALLQELEHIWSEIGESEADKDRMLLELERECLEVYRRKVDEANNAKVRLHQSVAKKEAELATLVAALGELSRHSQAIQTEKRPTSLKEQLAFITPLVEDLMKKKDDRVKHFEDIRAQIAKISGEISGRLNDAPSSHVSVNAQDLSQRKLDEYQTQLRTLQKEKSDRVRKILDYVNEVHSLCGMLQLDFGKTINEVHPSLQETGPEHCSNISDNTFEGLDQAIHKLKLERETRTQKLKDIVASLFELWNLMDSPEEERNHFGRITPILSSETEVTESGVLSLEIIDQRMQRDADCSAHRGDNRSTAHRGGGHVAFTIVVGPRIAMHNAAFGRGIVHRDIIHQNITMPRRLAAAEVERLTKLKAGRMKEIVLKRRLELEEICRKTHIEPDMSTAPEKSNAMIDSGIVDPSVLLADIEAEIIKAKDESLSRREILERIERWGAATEEETWLEDYNQDESRYSAGRGAHINLKRAERARVTITKIPAMVDALLHRTLVWENERKTLFLYDGKRLVNMLEDYKFTRQQKEEEKKQYRDQKKLQDLLLIEKEAMYGSRPSPKRSNSFRSTNGYRPNGNGSQTPTHRRLSVGSATPELLTPRSRSGRQNGHFKEMRRLSTAPLNFVSLQKDDTMSYASVCGSELESPPHG